MHKKLYKIIIGIIAVFLLFVAVFALINILSMKSNIQRQMDAYSKMFKAQGDKPEQISTTLDADKTKQYFLDYNSLAQGQNYELIIDYEDIEKGKWKSISIVDNKGVYFKEVLPS